MFLVSSVNEDIIKERKMKVKKLRLVVKRSWGQISVKDFEPQHADNLTNYAKQTWNDIKSTRIKVYREILK